MEKFHQNKPHAIALRCFDIATKACYDMKYFCGELRVRSQIVIGCFASLLILGRTHITSLYQMKSLDPRTLKIVCIKPFNKK